MPGVRGVTQMPGVEGGTPMPGVEGGTQMSGVEAGFGCLAFKGDSGAYDWRYNSSRGRSDAHKLCDAVSATAVA